MKPKVAFLAVLFFLNTCTSYAREAKVFTVLKSKEKAIEIVSDKGHFDVTFVMGWVSKKDGILTKIFSNATKLSAEASATGTYFDGDQLKNAWIVENTDIAHDLDRPWGAANKPLLSAIPADTVVASFTLKMAAYKEDRFKQLIDTFQKSEPSTGLAVEPYLTYAKVADAVFGSLFGTDKTNYPFLLDSGIPGDNVKSAHGMYEHYIIAIAPNSDKDVWLKAVDGSKLTYDSGSTILKYDGQAVQDHTFAIVLVGAATAPDIPKLLFSSRAAWAVLALTNFYNATLPDINAKDDVPRQDKAMVQQLGACIDQLKRELRFSAYDRAIALRAFADRAKKMISAACKAKNIGDADCKTPQIDAFEDGIDDTFSVTSAETKKEVPGGAQKLNQQLYQLLNLSE